jgi:hypothetical protein
MALDRICNGTVQAVPSTAALTELDFYQVSGNQVVGARNPRNFDEQTIASASFTA